MPSADRHTGHYGEVCGDAQSGITCSEQVYEYCALAEKQPAFLYK
jgi:hypothetical protein